MFSIIVVVLFVIKIYSNSVHSLPKQYNRLRNFVVDCCTLGLYCV